MAPLALYIHWPFCLAKCPYCDFNSHVREKIESSAWKKSFLTTLEFYRDILNQKQITSVFFGGGTPSLMPTDIVEEILNWLSTHCMLAADIEITLEANPTSVESEKLKSFRDAGINRLSMGIQSLRDCDLKFLGRHHSAKEAMNALALARTLFSNFSFDLIYARPNQTLKSWAEELEEALALESPHLSLYQLTIEKGTPFYKAFHEKEFSLPDENLAAELFSYTEERLARAGLHSYEVSNYARPHYQCKHNLSYWRYDDYLGIGPGAHSRVTIENKKTALLALHNPEAWVAAVAENHHGEQQRETLNAQEYLEEFLLMGLRLTEGISAHHFESHVGKSFTEIFPSSLLSSLYAEELLTHDQTTLRPTFRGRLVLNQLIKKLCESAHPTTTPSPSSPLIPSPSGRG